MANGRCKGLVMMVAMVPCVVYAVLVVLVVRVVVCVAVFVSCFVPYVVCDVRVVRVVCVVVCVAVFVSSFVPCGAMCHMPCAVCRVVVCHVVVCRLCRSSGARGRLRRPSERMGLKHKPARIVQLGKRPSENPLFKDIPRHRAAGRERPNSP